MRKNGYFLSQETYIIVNLSESFLYECNQMVTFITRNLYNSQSIGIIFIGMQPGDEVSVFVDVEKKCRKGFTKEFDGPKLFIGNGVAKFSRDEIFINNGGNISRYIPIIITTTVI